RGGRRVVPAVVAGEWKGGGGDRGRGALGPPVRLAGRCRGRFRHPSIVQRNVALRNPPGHGTVGINRNATKRFVQLEGCCGAFRADSGGDRCPTSDGSWPPSASPRSARLCSPGRLPWRRAPPPALRAPKRRP